MPATVSLEGYIAPLLSLSRENKLFIADCLYTHAEADTDDTPSNVDYNTMPGIFSREERIQRLIESYNCKQGKTLEEVKDQLLAI